jgi:hypothetical protein
VPTGPDGSYAILTVLAYQMPNRAAGNMNTVPPGTRFFDLNIDKFLEHWGPAEAVREIIANALDEQALTETAPVEILRDGPGVWRIRDYGRGLEPEHLKQNENPEKKRAAAGKQLLGRFGVGLKDALATLERRAVHVALRSRHGEIGLVRHDKHGFAGIPTLHAAIGPATDASFVGTEVSLRGIEDEAVETARRYFLRFADEKVLDATKVGQVLSRQPREPARIYVRGLRVAEEEGFAFSYNITELTAPMARALNRERTHVGRGVYTDRVKAILLGARAQAVASRLADELGRLETGDASEEIQWLDVQEHAVRILNAIGHAVFVTPQELREHAQLIEDSEADGSRVVVVPDRLREKLDNLRDTSGNAVRTVEVYAAERAASFVYHFLEPEELSSSELAVWGLWERTLALAGGRPRVVKEIRVSGTLRPQLGGGDRAMGVWEADLGRIVIHKDALVSRQLFAGTLLHELAHARSDATDLTPDFEDGLTELLGIVAGNVLDR